MGFSDCNCSRTKDEEIEGIDLTLHAESAYEFENRAGAGLSEVLSNKRIEA